LDVLKRALAEDPFLDRPDAIELLMGVPLLLPKSALCTQASHVQPAVSTICSW
jgi:hypothetical protein